MSGLSFSWRFALVGLRFSLAYEARRSILCVAVFGVHRGVGPGGGLLGRGGGLVRLRSALPGRWRKQAGDSLGSAQGSIKGIMGLTAQATLF